MDKDLFALVKIRASEYRALTVAYDEELAAAHRVNHGSPEMIEHLRRANEMAPDLRKSLELYHAAVAELGSRLSGR